MYNLVMHKPCIDLHLITKNPQKHIFVHIWNKKDVYHTHVLIFIF